MSPKQKVIVSHPGKQYVHQLLYALQKNDMLLKFFTSIWYIPDFWFYKLLLKLPVAGSFFYNKFLRKKTYPHQNNTLIEQYPWKEFIRQLKAQLHLRYRSEKYVFEVEKAHDRYVASRLKKIKPVVFIGYEKASLQSFRVVKEQKGTTVLDLAQVHYNYLIHLSKTQETFAELFNEKELFDEINRVKHAEYETADYILALSQFAKNTLTQNGIPASKIRVFNLGFNPAVFIPKTGYSTDSGLKLIFTGTFTKRKGVHLLLQCIKELELANLTLTIIGPVLDGEELFSQYKGLFEYHDFLHQEELVRYLHESDLYVFPSYLDSWAMTVVEAMACGIPVVVTENTGAKDAVMQGGGWIIPVNDKEALKERIIWAYNNKEQLKEIGLKARLVAENYTWDKYYEEVSSFISTLLR